MEKQPKPSSEPVLQNDGREQKHPDMFSPAPVSLSLHHLQREFTAPRLNRTAIQRLISLQSVIGNQGVRRLIAGQRRPALIQRQIRIKNPSGGISAYTEYTEDRLDDLIARLKGTQETGTWGKILKALPGDADNSQLKALLRQMIARHETYDGFNQFTGQIVRYLDDQGKTGIIHTGFGIAGKFGEGLAVLTEFFPAPALLNEIFFKIALMAELGEVVLIEQFFTLLSRIGGLIHNDVLPAAEVEASLEYLCSVWTTADINTPDKKAEKGTGIINKIRGTCAEFRSLLFAGSQNLQPGEQVHSGAVMGLEGTKTEQEADTSYIDDAGVLHLMESAATLDGLYAKLSKAETGLSGQKARLTLLSANPSQLTRRVGKSALPLPKITRVNFVYFLGEAPQSWTQIFTLEDGFIIKKLIECQATLQIVDLRFDCATLIRLNQIITPAMRDFRLIIEDALHLTTFWMPTLAQACPLMEVLSMSPQALVLKALNILLREYAAKPELLKRHAAELVALYMLPYRCPVDYVRALLQVRLKEMIDANDFLQQALKQRQKVELKELHQREFGDSDNDPWDDA